MAAVDPSLSARILLSLNRRRKAPPSLASTTPPTALLFLLFLTACLWLYCAIPPWQNPDEPTHIEYTALLAAHPGAAFHPEPNLPLERSILDSMAQWNFYRWVGMFPPHANPGQFPADPMLWSAPTKLHTPPLYYFLSGLWCRALGAEQPLAMLYLTRLFSLLAGLITVIGAWLAFQYLVPHDPHLRWGALAAMVLLPQFVMVSVSANSDILAIALVTGFIAWVFHPSMVRQTWKYWAGVATFVVLALLVKRIALLGLLLLPLLAFRRRGGVRTTLQSRSFLFGMTATVVIGVAALLGIPGLAERWVQAAIEFTGPFRHPLAHDWVAHPSAAFGQLLRYSKSLFAVFGWMRFPAPSWWFGAATLLTAASLLGWLRVAVSRFMRKESALPDAPWGVLWAFTGLSVLVVATRFAAWDHALQGRYLFPVLAPLALLIAGGWLALGGFRFGRPVLYGAVAGVAFLSGYALLVTLPRAFLAPPPGGVKQESRFLFLSPWHVESLPAFATADLQVPLEPTFLYTYQFGDTACDDLDLRGWFQGDGTVGAKQRFTYRVGTVPFPPVKGKGARISAELYPFSTAEMPDPGLTFQVNQAKIATTKLKKAWDTVTWFAPEAVLSAQTLNSVEFISHQNPSPQSLGVSLDRRPLGIALRNLWIEEFQGAPSGSPPSEKGKVEVAIAAGGERLSFPGFFTLSGRLVQEEVPLAKQFGLRLLKVEPPFNALGVPWELEVTARQLGRGNAYRTVLAHEDFRRFQEWNLQPGTWEITLRPIIQSLQSQVREFPRWTIGFSVTPPEKTASAHFYRLYTLSEGKPVPLNFPVVPGVLQWLLAGLLVLVMVLTFRQAKRMMRDE